MEAAVIVKVVKVDEAVWLVKRMEKILTVPCSSAVD